MENLTVDQISFAVAALEKIVRARELSQTQLAHLSCVSQSQICKIMNQQVVPTTDVVVKLFKALGLKLEDILHEAPISNADELLGYLATPLTAVVNSPRQNAELERVVGEVRQLATSAATEKPHFNLYWPGDYTHPTHNPDFKPNQVYLTDRSRASTFDFIVIFCASPSYGVGQENEIATQAGLPAIRLIPKNISRMMSGSFLYAVDVEYSGSLEGRIAFDARQFGDGLRQVRTTYFRHRALFHGMNGNDFGDRLRRLLDDRSGDDLSFAADLGISSLYLQSLTKEPFGVTNPSARLLKRMSNLLNVSVGYMLGETVDSDPVLVESLGEWSNWVDSTTGLDARIANRIKREWQDEYGKVHKPISIANISFRDTDTNRVQRALDWDRRYQAALGSLKGSNRAQQKGLF